MNYSRGSEWRKWDFHVHTPASILNNRFGSDWDKYVKALFKTAIENNIACIGITDYFSIEGYKKIKTNYIDNTEKLNELFVDEITQDPLFIEKILSILLLPNIELRLDNIVRIENENNSKNNKLEYHLLLSDELSISNIEDNILSQIKFGSDCSAQLGVDQVSLTHSNLERLGNRLKNTQPEYADKSDYEVGCMCAAINFTDFSNTLKRVDNEFNNKYLLILVEDDITDINWADAGHQIRKIIYSSSHMIFSSNPKTIKWGLRESTKAEFSTFKGCIWGSDAHEYQKLFTPDKNRHCWIKADPTFAGLLQVAIQPHNRTYIGNVPPPVDAVYKNKSKYIDEIRISKKTTARNNEEWFDTQLSLNPALIAIIGNKGSGKSALSDILGYLCQCKTMQDASFLQKGRFLREDKKYADDYEGTVKWADGHSIHVDGFYQNPSSTIEYAKYLPQRYIEKVCCDLGDEFQDEINDVIFSYIDVNERANTTNLRDLIDAKCAQFYENIILEHNKLEKINKEIIALEDKSSLSYRKECKEQLDYCNEELMRIKANKPDDIPDPSKHEDEENAKRILEIDNLVSELDTKINQVTSHSAQKEEKVNQIKNIISGLESVKISIKEFNERYEKFALDNGLSKEKPLVEIIANSDILLGFLNILEEDIRDYGKQLMLPPEEIHWEDAAEISKYDNLFMDSLKYQRERLLNEKGILVLQTSAEQQIYQKYLDDIKEWNDRQTRLLGDYKTEHTIAYYETILDYLNQELKSDLATLDDKRLECIQSVYTNYKLVSSILSDLYEPVKKKLENILESQEETIDFSADVIAGKNLASEISQKINKKSKGVFRGIAETNAFLDELIRSTNFNEFESFKTFFVQIVNVVRGSDFEQISRVIPDREDFYRFLSEMRYISAEYTLKLGNKTIGEMSPGERGMVLLVFYLALSKDNIPIIIDQPEDNLDNQSVYSKLVPCIIEAKKNRQVIIVTHNPNIAVACDAEQIIYCSIDKSKTKISYLAGSIENQVIRNKTIDVLEGTEPAFDLRKSKYFYSFLHKPKIN